MQRATLAFSKLLNISRYSCRTVPIHVGFFGIEDADDVESSIFIHFMAGFLNYARYLLNLCTLAS